MQSLFDLGWSNFYQSQLSLQETEAAAPARVMAVHRNGLDILGIAVEGRVPAGDSTGDEDTCTVGDWVLVNQTRMTVVRRLERKSLFKRRAAGPASKIQLIAANVDTLFIVSSCNLDFNIARLERYMALAQTAGAEPVIVLTKADSADDPAGYEHQARTIMPGVVVAALDARETADVEVLHAWCGRGQTIALVGSSGVGKSTLVNTLLGNAAQTTQGIREDDAKGRHTTTARSLHPMASGCWLLDTPGMRELQLTDVTTGIDAVFSDVAELEAQCRFSDCRHQNEPGCRIAAALNDGLIDQDRVRRYFKLKNEDARNSMSIAERRANQKKWGRTTKRIIKEKNDLKGR